MRWCCMGVHGCACVCIGVHGCVSVRTRVLTVVDRNFNVVVIGHGFFSTAAAYMELSLRESARTLKPSDVDSSATNEEEKTYSFV